MSYNNNIESKRKSEKINKHYLYCDFDAMPKITDKVREENLPKIFIGGVRINNGMYWTDDEYDTYISESLKRELP